MRVGVRLLLVVLSLLGAQAAHACSCIAQGPVCAIQMGTSTIFRGTVVEKTLLPNITTVKKDDGTIQQLVGNGQFRVKFSVVETFSGGSQAEQVVYTNQQGSMCGFDFHEGQEYLVFTYVNKGELWTSHCMRTTLLESGTDNEAIRWMRSRTTAPSGSEILGAVLLPRDSPQRTVPATIHLSGPSDHTTQTDSSGHYEAMGLPPGEYNMSATVPVGFSISPGPSKVTVQDKGCAELDWHVTYEGQISGRVRSVDGQPVADLTLALEPEVSQRSGYDRKVLVTTELDGTYHFDHLSPGQYVLSTRDAFALTGDTPVFYPKTIEVGESTATGGYDLTLGKLKPTKPIRVTILKPDGSPAKVGLMLFAFPNGNHGDEPTRSAVSDASGVAVLPLQMNKEYAISIALDRDHPNCGMVMKSFFYGQDSTTVSITSPERCQK